MHANKFTYDVQNSSRTTQRQLLTPVPSPVSKVKTPHIVTLLPQSILAAWTMEIKPSRKKPRMIFISRSTDHKQHQQLLRDKPATRGCRKRRRLEKRVPLEINVSRTVMLMGVLVTHIIRIPKRVLTWAF